MKQVILVLLFCTSYTAWASWSPAANDLVIDQFRIFNPTTPSTPYIGPLPMINSEGSAMITIQESVITAYGRAPNSDWNKIGELLVSDPILSDYAYTSFNFPFAASSSLEKFVTYEQGGWDSINNQPLPAKIITLTYTNNIWSSSEFQFPTDEYVNITDIGISKNGQRIAIKTFLQNLVNDPTNIGFYYPSVVVFENILGAWAKVGEPIPITGSESGIILDENGDNLTFRINHNTDNSNITDPVKVFTYANGSWSQKGDNIYPNDDFDEHGRVVSISGDGQRIAVSSQKANGINPIEFGFGIQGVPVGPDVGCVNIYQYDNSDWQLISTLFGEDAGDQFGTNFHLSSNGNRIAIGSANHDNYSGHIRVFDYDSSLESYSTAGRKYSQAGNDINGSEYEGIGERFVMSGDGTTIISINGIDSKLDPVSYNPVDALKTYSYSAPTDESVDTDGDGLTNATELSLGTNPNLVDTDGDGFPDGWEVSRNLDPTVNSSDFISNINGYGYYSTEQISDLRPGSTMIEVQNGQATLSMEVEQSDDLEIWTSGGTTNLQIPIDPNSDTKFFRFKMAE